MKMTEIATHLSRFWRFAPRRDGKEIASPVQTKRLGAGSPAIRLQQLEVRPDP